MLNCIAPFKGVLAASVHWPAVDGDATHSEGVSVVVALVGRPVMTNATAAGKLVPLLGVTSNE